MDQDLVNHGVIEYTPRGVVTADTGAPGTIIVTGLGRSGTSMIAAVLKEAGLHIGEFVADAVYEDRELLDLCGRRDHAGLQRAIQARDTAHAVWGFKLPNLHRYLKHSDLARFRGVRLVIPLRDVAAVAVRHAIAEHWDAFQAMSDIADGTVALLHFARLSGCPVLLISYEKALAFPDETIARLMEFCGLSVDRWTLARLRDRISPNDADYAVHARRTYEGMLERVDEEGRLVGWCRQTGEISPVRLQVLLGGVTLACFDACLPRDDLLEAGLGNGSHGFAHPLDVAVLPPATTLRVRVEGTTWELPGSGRTMHDLVGRRDPPAEEHQRPKRRAAGRR